MTEESAPMGPFPSVGAARREMIDAIAERTHDHWRANRWREATQSYEPRIKLTTDKWWIKRHGTNEVDIANTGYRDLPADWQQESRTGAIIALDEIAEEMQDQLDGKPAFGMGFEERVAAEEHLQWVLRHPDCETRLRVSYDNLAREEQEKDLVFVRASLDAFKEYMFELSHPELLFKQGTSKSVGREASVGVSKTVEFPPFA